MFGSLFPKRLRLVAVLLGVTLTATATAEGRNDPDVPLIAPRPGVLLRYRFAAGDFVRYRNKQFQKTATRVKEFSESSTTTAYEQKHYRVISVDRKGNAYLELTLDRVLMEAKFGEDPVLTYDSSANKRPPTQFAHLHRRIGRPSARGKFDARGNLISLTDLNNNIRQAKATDSEEAGNDALTSFLVVFPEEPVHHGDSWSDILIVPVRHPEWKQVRMEVKLLRRYTLTGMEGNLATIEMKTSVLTPLRNPILKAQLIQRTGAGTIVFDTASGQIVSRDMEFNGEVIGVLGPQSLMKAKSLVGERLVTD